ncbi:MAG: CDP-alcohol phosphatidyltransferase family protein [Anaerolineae bacterium]|nr:CDP-alcohol phosphatidyltransferase family protein [Anaerolineae bacterium]
MTNKINHTNKRTWFVCSFTALNMVLGLMALFAAAAGLLPLAAACLLGSVLCDVLDGMLARKLNANSEFGEQFDSLADMTSFTIASAALGYYWLQASAPAPILLGASALWVVAGAARLARFNVTPYNGYYFQGMPTTAVSAVLAVAYLTLPQVHWGLGVALFVALALLMVSVFPYVKFAQLRRLPKWCWLLVVILGVLNFTWLCWAAAIAYVCSGPVMWARRRWA